MSQSIDHRWGTRLACRESIELRPPGGSVMCAELREISMSGALVATPAGFPVLQQVSVRPAGSATHWRRAFVIRNQQGSIALEWFEPGIETIAAFLPRDATMQPMPMHRTLAYMQSHSSAC